MTIGDSWTWGDDLTETNDNNFRKQAVYGSQIAKKFNFDFLNLGQCGASNFWIAEKCNELESVIPELSYKQIIVICMFTEAGRSINSYYDKEFNFIEFFKNCNTKNDFYNLLALSNNQAVDRILSIKKFNHIKLIFGTNLVDPIGMEKADILLKPWFRIMANFNNLPQPPEVYLIHSGAVDSVKSTIDMVPLEKQNMFLSWVIDLIESSKSADIIFKNNIFRSYHPLASGHTLIATEIIKEIQSW